MRDRMDRHFEGMALRAEADRRNGFFCRHLLTGLGDITLNVPRTRTTSEVGLIQAYSRRAVRVDRMIYPVLVWDYLQGR